MTAEVAILNRHAVAMAADSAVTVSGPYGSKIYNTVNKLFALSKYNPVGIMVYSSAEVMGVPVETVVKHFRSEHLKLDCPNKLEEYEHRFKDFLINDSELFPEEARLADCERIVADKIDSVLEFVNEQLYEIANPKLSFKKAMQQVRATVLVDLTGYLGTLPEVPNVTDQVRSKIKDQLSHYLRPALIDKLSPNANVTSSEEKAVDELLDRLMFRIGNVRLSSNVTLRGSETGFVISGFGDTEYFPRLNSFEFNFSIDSVTSIRNAQAVEISRDKRAAIIPFAQTDMVETFIEGRSKTMNSTVGQAINAYFEGRKEEIRQRRGLRKSSRDVKIREIERQSNDIKDFVADRLATWTRDQHVMPTLQTLQALPKEELAVIAEALVNLTIHKRRASPDAETVGPPTDVAVISRGDGFIWIKRKHYFKPELNPHFMINYYRKS